MVRLEKRHMLLLEVLIAFALVSLAILPLIYPHTALLKFQREFIQKIELDHFVNRFHAEMIEKLYQNEIDWSVIATERVVPITVPDELPYEGSYQFSFKRRKPLDEKPKVHYLYDLDYIFLPKSGGKPIKFRNIVFIIRDLGEEENVQE